MKVMNNVKFALYTSMHPLDGFYEIRHRNKGSEFLALLFVFIFSISFSINKQYASFIVNENNTQYVNSIIDLIGIFLFYLLFCMANWSVTCLMEGEGRFKDIITITGYATLPFIFTLIPATIISHFIAANEEALYYLILSVSLIWFAIILALGIMTIHNFSLGKTILTGLLTFFAMVIIIFVTVLIFSLIQQIFLFLKSIYTELVFSI